MQMRFEVMAWNGICSGVFLIGLALPALADEPKVELLWPAGAPGAKGETEPDKPTITIYPAPNRTAPGPAMLVCPGGGYGHLAVDHEGEQIAHWCNEHGITAAVLRYRIAPRYMHPAPSDDAKRALRMLRAHAKDWQIDPSKISLMGFSAGGHLASTVGTHFDAGQPDAKDPIERESCRPDALVLCYPVVALASEYAHAGSRKNLLGEQPDRALLESLSNDQQVTAETPPTFLFHTTADKPVPPENSVLFYLALCRAQVPAELHIFEQGPHGVGLAAKDPVLSVWPQLLASWLKGRGLAD
jgi:acetyl esterase/lipase